MPVDIDEAELRALIEDWYDYADECMDADSHLARGHGVGYLSCAEELDGLLTEAVVGWGGVPRHVRERDDE